MKAIKYISAALLICLPIFSNAQSITFTKYYDNGISGCFNVLELQDGYLMASFGSQNIFPKYLYLIKTDFYGDTMWQRKFGDTTEYRAPYSLIRTWDGNFIVGSYKSNQLKNTAVVCLLKFDSNGDTIWTSEIPSPPGYYYNGQFVIETSDKGFLVSGQRVDTNKTNADAAIVKTDSLGNFQWAQVFGGVEFDNAASSVELPDKGFLSLGWTRSFGLGSRDMYLIKTDSLGNFKWQKTFGTGYLDSGYGITATSDGNILLAGTKGIPSILEIRSWLIKVDTAGTMLWQKTYTNTQGEMWWARELNDGCIAGVGSVAGVNAKDSGWIIKTDNAGNLLWDRGFMAGNQHSYFRDFKQTTDNGFICTGFVFNGPSGTQDAWLIKLDSLGCDSFGCPTVYSGVGINELNNYAEFSVYPNPVKELLTIHFSYSLFSACNIKIYNMLGSEVYSSRTFIQRQATVPVSDLPSGVYLLRLKYEGQLVSRKFIKN